MCVVGEVCVWLEGVCGYLCTRACGCVCVCVGEEGGMEISLCVYINYSCSFLCVLFGVFFPSTAGKCVYIIVYGCCKVMAASSTGEVIEIDRLKAGIVLI